MQENSSRGRYCSSLKVPKLLVLAGRSCGISSAAAHRRIHFSCSENGVLVSSLFIDLEYFSPSFSVGQNKKIKQMARGDVTGPYWRSPRATRCTASPHLRSSIPSPSVITFSSPPPPPSSPCFTSPVSAAFISHFIISLFPLSSHPREWEGGLEGFDWGRMLRLRSARLAVRCGYCGDAAAALAGRGGCWQDEITSRLRMNIPFLERCGQVGKGRDGAQAKEVADGERPRGFGRLSLSSVPVARLPLAAPDGLDWLL